MRKNSYVVLILWSVLLTGVVAFFSAGAVILQLSENQVILSQIAAFAVMALFFSGYIKKQPGAFQRFGFKRKIVSVKYLVILAVVVLAQPVILGIRGGFSLGTVALLVIQMLLVGYTEEVLFRSIFFDKLQGKKPVVYIVFSAFIFGILHSASGIDPEAAAILVWLQIVNAVLLGLLFAVIYYQTRQLGLLIIAHALFNILATLANSGSVEQNVLVVAVLLVIYLLAIVYLVKTGSSSQLRGK